MVSMRVHFYGLVWNEARMLPFFFHHYDPVVDHYIFYDDGSDDGTRELIKAHPRTELRDAPRWQETVCEESTALQSTCWHESRNKADFVIIADVDEFLHAPEGLAFFLQKAKKNSWEQIPSHGFQLVSDTFPQENGSSILDQVQYGFRHELYDKLCCFNPDAIEHLCYAPGCHKVQVIGGRESPEPLRLLHAKFLGMEYVIQRNQELNKKILNGDRARSYGHQYSWTPEYIKATIFDRKRERVV